MCAICEEMGPEFAAEIEAVAPMPENPDPALFEFSKKIAAGIRASKADGTWK
ncbi:MAG TPA: hypothetical protein VIY48_19135 [Candidatus Paceibacterota bacterium]